MSKKKRSTKVSKGERRNVSKSAVHTARIGVPYIDKAINTLKAWKKGKNPWITVDQLRYRANELYGDPRKTAIIGAQNND